MNLKRLVWIVYLLALPSCQPTTLEDFQLEGAPLARRLLEDLKKIETREDLLLLEPALKRDFEKLVDLMIQARAFQQKNLDLEIPFQNINQILNASLLEEMKRVYEIEGGRESVERAQREALLKLDAKEKSFQRVQNSMR
jgi:hypothetical protein